MDYTLILTERKQPKIEGWYYTNLGHLYYMLTKKVGLDIYWERWTKDSGDNTPLKGVKIWFEAK